jgi:hypothetical protein
VIFDVAILLAKSLGLDRSSASLFAYVFSFVLNTCIVVVVYYLGGFVVVVVVVDHLPTIPTSSVNLSPDIRSILYTVVVSSWYLFLSLLLLLIWILTFFMNAIAQVFVHPYISVACVCVAELINLCRRYHLV